jgi:primase-polymerase (primpol)-like protein
LISTPEPWLQVPIELLEALAALAPYDIKPPARDASTGNLVEAIQGDTGTAQLSDQSIIHRAHRARNHKKFRQLWNGDTSSYQSHSDADEALLMMLAFWTNRDPTAMDRLFRESGLYRDKWEREDYRERSIQKACDYCTTTYQPSQSTSRKLLADDTDTCAEIDNLRNIIADPD